MKSKINLFAVLNTALTSFFTYLTFVFNDYDPVMENIGEILNIGAANFLICIVFGVGGYIFTITIRKMVIAENKRLVRNERKELLTRIRKLEEADKNNQSKFVKHPDFDEVKNKVNNLEASLVKIDRGLTILEMIMKYRGSMLYSVSSWAKNGDGDFMADLQKWKIELSHISYEITQTYKLDDREYSNIIAKHYPYESYRNQ